MIKQMSKKTCRAMTAILVFSALIGCSSKKIIRPKTTTSLSQIQDTYEHIPKPISSMYPSTSLQYAEFKSELYVIFKGIDRYRNSLRLKTQKRYGKNMLLPKPQKKTHPKRLYPKLNNVSSPKDPLSRAS